MQIREFVLNLNDRNLDGMIFGTGIMATMIDWIAQHTDLVAIWVGTIIIPATIRIWQFREKLKDNEIRRAREETLHSLTVQQMQQDLIQDQEQHKKKNK